MGTRSSRELKDIFMVIHLYSHTMHEPQRLGSLQHSGPSWGWKVAPARPESFERPLGGAPVSLESILQPLPHEAERRAWPRDPGSLLQASRPPEMMDSQGVFL